jgi:hypothetical protein
MPGSYAVTVWKPSARALMDAHNAAMLAMESGARPTETGVMHGSGAMASMARAGNRDPEPDVLPAHLSDPETSGLTAIVRVEGKNDFTFAVEQ